MFSGQNLSRSKQRKRKIKLTIDAILMMYQTELLQMLATG